MGEVKNLGTRRGGNESSGRSRRGRRQAWLRLFMGGGVFAVGIYGCFVLWISSSFHWIQDLGAHEVDMTVPPTTNAWTRTMNLDVKKEDKSQRRKNLEENVPSAKPTPKPKMTAKPRESRVSSSSSSSISAELKTLATTATSKSASKAPANSASSPASSSSPRSSTSASSVTSRTSASSVPKSSATKSLSVDVQDYTSVINLKAKMHLFWRGRQKRMCQLMASTVNLTDDKFFRRGGFTGVGALQTNATTATLPPPPTFPKVLLNFTTSCSALPDAIDGYGLGNQIMAIYGLRLAAATAGADLLFVCADDSPQLRASTVLPWLQGFFAANESLPASSPFTPNRPTLRDACRGMGHNPIHYMMHAIQREMRHMSFSLLSDGTTAKEALSLTDTETTSLSRGPPLLPMDALLTMDALDDVAVHFRCGDLLMVPHMGGYGFVKFRAYRKRIPPTVRSIGIITAPFEPHRNRLRDRGSLRHCRLVIQHLQRYLASAFPQATVTIRNGPKETLTSAYARLVLAPQQMFCSATTFGVFPAIASVGQQGAYLQDSPVNYIAPPIAKISNHLNLMKGDFLTGAGVNKFRGDYNKLLAWFDDDDDDDANATRPF